MPDHDPLHHADHARSTGSGDDTTPAHLRWAALLAAAAFAAFWADAPIADALRRAHDLLGGDVRKAFETAGQYGQGAFIILTAAVILLMDRELRRRLLDFGAALLLTALITLPAKMLIGRPRPKFEDPHILLGPWGAYPLGTDVGVRHAWELGSGISADLWSMPSAHTAYAVTTTVFLSAVYPRLRPLVIPLAVLVGLSRVMLGKHYPSDVLAGAAIAVAVAVPAVRGYWGTRAVDRIWRALIDADAEPAEPALRSAQTRRSPRT